MPKSFVVPDNREYPDYEFREFPKHLGFDVNGIDIEVADADEEAERAGEVVYPKTLGKDRAGKDVIAMGPTDETWKLKTVVAPKEVAEADPVRRGPGRPKSEAA